MGEIMKNDCKAIIYANEQFDDEKITVTYKNEHNHSINSVDSWKKQRLPPVVRNWLKELVAAGTNWEIFKSISRPSEGVLTALDFGKMSKVEPFSIPHSMRVTRKQFSYYRRNFLKDVGQLDACQILD